MVINKSFCIALCVIIAAGTFVWWYSRPYPPKETLPSQQEANVKKMLKEMQTRCVGRYLIDLPASFSPYRSSQKLEDNNWVANVSMPDDWWKTYITTKRMYYPAFEQFIQRRQKELEEETVSNPLDGPYLKKIWSLPEGLKGIIFERNESFLTPDSTRIIEAYLYTNGVAIKLQKESVNDSTPRYKKDRERRGKETNFIPRDIDNIKKLLSRITGRQEGEIPTMPGSCIADAFIATDRYVQEQEDIHSNYTSDIVRGWMISLNMDNFTKGNDGVLERAKDISRDVSRMHGRIVRNRAFDTNGLHVEEMLLMAPEPSNNQARYSFGLYINEKTAGYKSPGLTMELDNISQIPGFYTQEDSIIYTQEEIMTFWDNITHTIRLRPNAL
ncbi:T6SS immunity protein Tli4 family protein [Pseudenterobacter timonensis]|uniref:T6SS immunity protein Tli4 family protein n=1 Tax=Pseudenterobacter timonensis TaxID=1755099 RepID=A0AAE4IUW6_9ENTR|nr:T6SS immunity protein Tli4 family protein [Pseudenterobacter timonensis]MDR9891308.1 T6SS immunity protein Tli4 family protein [Pseudenterobacter timonensis]